MLECLHGEGEARGWQQDITQVTREVLDTGLIVVNGRLGGQVYNLTPYLQYHPGGADILVKTAGRDGTALFNRYHPWVNLEGIAGVSFLLSVGVDCYRAWSGWLARCWLPSNNCLPSGRTSIAISLLSPAD